jgi:hypothetical protein
MIKAREGTNSVGIECEGLVGEVEKGNTAKEDRQPDPVNFFSSEKTRKYFEDIETEPDKLMFAT